MAERLRQNINRALDILLAVGVLGSMSLLLKNVRASTSVDELNNYDSARVTACWNEEGMEEYVPTIVPTPDRSPSIEATQTAVQMDRREEIAGTQEAMQGAAEAYDLFAEMGEDYMGAVVRYEISIPVEPRSNQFMRYTGGSALMVGAEFVKTRIPEEPSPLWVFLTNNHVVDDRIKASVAADDFIGFEFRGVDTQTARVSDSFALTQIVGCRNIVADGYHIATLLAVRGFPGMSLGGNRTPPLAPFPLERTGGPCALGDSEIRTVSFPRAQDGSDLQPLLTEVEGPLRTYEGPDYDGIYTRFIFGYGLSNFGSSGGNLLDANGEICAIVNYTDANNARLVGFSVLPDSQFMRDQVRSFLEQQAEALQGLDW